MLIASQTGQDKSVQKNKAKLLSQDSFPLPENYFNALWQDISELG